MDYGWLQDFRAWCDRVRREGKGAGDPIHHVARYWDEWTRTSEGAAALRALREVDEGEQSAVVHWLWRYYRDAGIAARYRNVGGYVLHKLAGCTPFLAWRAFDRYRDSYGSCGIPAIVVAASGPGTAADVKEMSVAALPCDPDEQGISAENVETIRDRDALPNAAAAACSLLCGAGMPALLALWALAGHRPCPQWRRTAVDLLWMLAIALLASAVGGVYEPEDLERVVAGVVVCWTVAATWTVAETATAFVTAVRQGRRWRKLLARSHVSILLAERMQVTGPSMGLTLGLNVLWSAYRAQPVWGGIWGRLMRQLGRRRDLGATGELTKWGWVKPVDLRQKIEAALSHPRIAHLLAPFQWGATHFGVRPVRRQWGQLNQQAQADAPAGYASDAGLSVHACVHLARAVLEAGGQWSRAQLLRSSLLLIFGVLMATALPGVRCILDPPADPELAQPTRRIPGQIDVSLDTDREACFCVRLDSPYWEPRRADVVHIKQGEWPSRRAEISLRRRVRPAGRGGDGDIHVVRQYRLLWRTFPREDPAGSYSLAYVDELGWRAQ